MRRHVLIHESDECNVWMIEWPPGTGLDWHGHGDSTAHILVVEGVLTEEVRWENWKSASEASEYMAGGTIWRYPDQRHKVINNGLTTAVSIHVYTPPLTMEYDEKLEITPW